MVMRTEYHGQRYSMGSSDPLPARFEIRFGSLNFQAMGNDYLMRITNRDELRARRPTGPGPVPTRCRRLPKRMLRSIQHLDVDVAPVSALDRRGQRTSLLPFEGRRVFEA
jgi:hypothetical protein